MLVRLGYQKIGPPFLLKERSESLKQRLAQTSARVEWVEFPAGPPLLEAMRAGAVDIGYTGETPPVFAQAGGVPFVYRQDGGRVRKQEVVTGIMNEDEVVILKGLEEDDRVLLLPPPDKDRLELVRLPGSGAPTAGGDTALSPVTVPPGPATPNGSPQAAAPAPARKN